MEPTRGSSSSNTLQLGRAQNESVDNNESFGGSSSSVQWQPKAGAFAHRHNPQLAHIHVVAGSEWSEESEQSQNGSVDCAVEVQVVVQQTQPVKPEAEPQPQPKRSRSRLRCCGIALLVLGLLATGVLVPIAVTVGFETDIPPEYRVLQPPAPSHRLIFALEASATASTAEEVFPAAIANKVISWTALPSSAIHVAAFTDAQAMQQALAHLEAGVAALPARHLMGTKSAWSLKYAVADFELLTDRRVSQVVDPMQLFDLAKHQTRYLLQQQQQQHGAATQPLVDPDIDEDYYLWQLQQRADVWHQQQQRARQTAAAEAASASGVPRTAAVRDVGDQQTRRRHLMSIQQQQQGSATGAAAGAAGAELLPVVWREPAGATSTVLQPPSATHITEAGLHLTGHAFQRSEPYSSSGSWGSIVSRTLLQSAARAVPARGRPQLQVHQRQAQQQVQRGGSQVAWHLTNSGLGLREAWNVTSGMDRVVVAVIDSGVEVASSAVGAALWTNAAEVAGDGIDNDGNGYEDDVTGWDFGGACADVTCSYCTPGPDPTDTVGWGTHAAAAVGAQPEVGSGTAGISPGVRIMPLKVSDCRNGMQMWDVTTQQGGLVKALDGSTDSSSSSSTATDPAAQLASQQGLGPALLGSAAVQAMDYALLNGAHIVLAAWTAGGLRTGDASSGGQCMMGAAAAAAEGVDAAVARGGSGCLAAVQRLVFKDALKPLQEAGVLIVTTQDSRSSQRATTPPAAAGPPLPCSLSCDFDNVLCVSASTTMLPPASSQGGLTDVLSASDFFAPLTDQHSRSYYAWSDSSTDADSSDTASFGDDSSSEDSTAAEETDANSAVPAAAQAARAAARSSSLRAVRATCEARSSKGTYAQLRAPGTDILAGWAWGSHALVSGSSAAASVAAGAAALTWSKLGQTLGADASPGAFEGLGQQVKQQLLQGATVSVITNGSRSSSDAGSGTSSTSSSDAGSSTGSSGSSSSSAFTPLREAARAGPASTGPPRSSSSSSLVSSSPTAAPAAAPAPLELDLFGALQEASQPPAVVALQPAVLSPAVTSACKALRYTWHIRADDSGPYDTNAMWYVARKALKPPGFPITRWEFYGSTSLLEATAYLDVSVPGVYELAASSEDRFMLWLQDWWLHMREAPERGPGSWIARINFVAPGLYKLRLIVYSPGKPFDLQWKPPTSSSFVPITSYVSLGQTQPLPQQLLQTMLLPLAARADSSSERSSREAIHASSSKGSLGSNSQGTFVASSSSSSSDSAPSFEALPESPGGQVSSSADGNDTADDTSSGLGMGTPPAWDPEDDASSLTATMEPPEGASDGREPTLAADLTNDDATAAAAAGPGVDRVPYAPAVTGYQLRPAYTPYLAGAGDAGYGGGGGDMWGSLRSFFGGGGWFGRRRLLSHRRSLLVSDSLQGTGPELAVQQLGPRRSLDSMSAGEVSVASAQGSEATDRTLQHLQQPLQAQQQQQQLRRLAVAADTAAPAAPPAAPRRVQEAGNRGSSSSGSSPWGRFSLAVTFPEKTQYRTLTPDMTKLEFTHTGVLPGPGLAIGGWLNLQEAVLGFSDPQDNRGAYGMIQGWLDWRDLNPAAAAAITAVTGAAPAAADAPAAAVALGSGSTRNSITVEGAGLGGTLGGVSVGSAGVQFEVQCDDCSLQIDGMTVAGSLGPPETSSCVVPAATAARRSSSSWAQKQQQLLHMELLFSTNDARNVKVSVRARPCHGVHSMAGSGAWMQLTAAGSSPPAFSVASAAVSKEVGYADGAEGLTSFKRGMLCTVKATPPTAAAAGNTSSDVVVGGGQELQQSVFLSADRMREAVAVPLNETGSINAAAMVYTSSKEPDSTNSSSSSNSSAVSNATSTTTTTASSSNTASEQSLTVDAPAGMNGDEAGPAGPPRANTTANITAEQAAEAAARAAEQQLRAAQVAAAKAAALARGITVADLVPDWVASLPAETRYSLSCGCYWNGSWEGNVSVAVSAAAAAGGGSTGSGGRARLFLAGWPVAAKVGRALGPSDLDVRAYSTLLQRQQLAAGSDSADPLVDTAYSWAASGGVFGEAGSSTGGAGVTSSSSRLLGGGDGADSSSTSNGGSALSAAAVRARRAARMQQQSVSRSSSSASSAGSSSLLGLQPLGSIDGVSRRVVMPAAGQHQLLVLQAEDVTGDAQVVVMAPGDTSSSSGSKLAAGDGSSSDGGSMISSWLPGAWDAWVPAG